MTEDMIWDDPPPVKESPYDWVAIAKKLKRRPRKWLKIFQEDRYSYVVTIRQGNIRALKAKDGFEVRTSNNKNARTLGVPRTCTLHMRYNPDKKEK